MSSTTLNQEIRELNLSYLMLAQQMLREDREGAMFRLGIGADLAELLVDMSPAQVVRVSSGDMLLCRVRFEDSMIFNLLGSHGRQAATAGLHAAIVAASKPVQELVL